MKKLNEYFFGEESISLSDGLWFYGSCSLALIMAIYFIKELITWQ